MEIILHLTNESQYSILYNTEYMYYTIIFHYVCLSFVVISINWVNFNQSITLNIYSNTLLILSTNSFYSYLSFVLVTDSCDMTIQYSQ
jgi:hypothetical protein